MCELINKKSLSNISAGFRWNFEGVWGKYLKYFAILLRKENSVEFRMKNSLNFLLQHFKKKWINSHFIANNQSFFNLNAWMNDWLNECLSKYNSLPTVIQKNPIGKISQQFPKINQTLIPCRAQKFVIVTASSKKMETKLTAVNEMG